MDDLIIPTFSLPPILFGILMTHNNDPHVFIRPYRYILAAYWSQLHNYQKGSQFSSGSLTTISFEGEIIHNSQVASY